MAGAKPETGTCSLDRPNDVDFVKLHQNFLKKIAGRTSLMGTALTLTEAVPFVVVVVELPVLKIFPRYPEVDLSQLSSGNLANFLTGFSMFS